MKKVRVIVLIVTIFFIIIYIKNVWNIIFKDIVTSGKDYKYDTVEDIRKILKSSKNKIIIIDPGHGGKDPGKVGVSGALEKDINLSIAFKLRDYLLKSGFSVIMTRNCDEGLYSDMDRNKKSVDLRNRVNLIKGSDAIAVVSIHQNSYTNSNEKGAQVFYYNNSNISKDLAKCVQDSLINNCDKYNKRVEKANTSYYLLKKTIKPVIIVECGFLSNGEESDKLISEDYQSNIAEAINIGIINWANKILN